VYFQSILTLENFDILLFTEHWENAENLKLINIKNFKLASQYSRETHIHGGSVIFVKNNIHFKCREDILKLNSELNFEISAIEIVQANTIYCCIYRSPNSDIDIFMDKMSSLLDLIYLEGKTCILVGDYNLDSLNPSHLYNILSDLCQSYDFINIINCPTRIQGNSSTCIDHCYTNNKDNLEFVINKNRISDHFGIELYQSKLTISDIGTSMFRRKSLNAKLVDKVNNLLKCVDWNILKEINGADNKYAKFHTILLDILDKIIPVTLVKPKIGKMESNDRLTMELTEQVKLFEELHIQYPGNNLYSENLNQSKIKLKNYMQFKTCKSNAKQISESSNKSKTAWNIVYSNINKSKSSVNTVSEIKYNDIEITKPDDIAEVLNGYFVNKPTELVSKINKDQVTTQRGQYNYNTFFITPTDGLEVVQTILSLKNSKAYDCYDVSTEIVKAIAHSIKEPIAYLFNASILEGIYPSLLKSSKVIPIYKNKDPSDPNNYRPISLLPIVSKVFESLMLRRLNEFLIKFNIIDKSQHGFRKGFSTTTAAFQFIEKIYEAMDNRKKPLGLFIDLSKAFDLVDHKILLTKLEHIGVRGISNDWFKSYLSNRNQKVSVNTLQGVGNSKSLGVDRGVPQGSILGPILYILYVNDFANNLDNCDKTCYADDTNILLCNTDDNLLHEEAKEILKKCKEYFNANNLVMNDSKTTVVQFMNKNNSKKLSHIKLKDAVLDVCDHVKFLGLFIDSNLNWKHHVDTLCKKLSSALFALRVLKNNVEISTLKMIYFALFQSHLSYGIILWGNSSQQNINRVLILQKKAVRVLFDLQHMETCRHAYKEMQILTVTGLYIYNILVYYKLHSCDFRNDTVQHNYVTRNKMGSLRPLKHNTTLFEKSVTYSATQLYNMLPLNMKELCLRDFKNSLLKFLLKNPFYCLNEFIECDKCDII
jgi:hypothetical protein